MKSLSRDIKLTLLIKTILLVLLWWVCVKTLHPVVESRANWFFGVSEVQSSPSIATSETK